MSQPACDAGGRAVTIGAGSGLIVNGTAREYPAGEAPATVDALIRAMGLAPGMVVAEVNGQIIRRADIAAHTLAAGDRVELVRLVGGG